MSATKEFLLQRPHFFARILFYISTFLILFVFTLLWFATINITAKGDGVISTENGQREIFTNSKGVILEIFVKKGAQVKKGQILATINSDEVAIGNALIENNHMVHERAKQELQSIINVSKIEIMASSESIKRINEQEQLAEKLYNEGFTTKIAYLKAKDDLVTAKANLEKMKNTYLKQTNDAKSKLMNVELESKNQKRKIVLSNANRGNSESNKDGLDALYAPCDGIVALAQHWSINTPINTQEPVFIIVPSDEKLIAKIEIPSSNMTNIRLGENVKLKIDAYPFKQFGVWQGELSYISATSKVTKSGAVIYEAYISIDEKDMAKKNKELIMGQTLKAEIVVQRKRILIYILDYLRGMAQ
jgi:multidrug resistance efflux pump